jgi:hypothetical protein
MSDRPIPHDLEAEECLLGAMMLSREAIRAAAEVGIETGDFYKHIHAHINRAIVTVAETGAPGDPTLVAAQLNGQLDDVGGRKELLRIQAATPASANAIHYAHLVHTTWIRRQLLIAAHQLDELARNGDSPAHILERISLLNAQLADATDNNETWDQVDLAPALTGTINRPEPSVGVRDDGHALFYPQRVNGVHGDSGLGKSMLLAYTCAQELQAGRHVAYIDFEDPDGSTIVERLRLFNTDDPTITELFHYYCPQEAFTDPVIATIATQATLEQWTLIVIDSLGEAFGLEGINEDKDVEVGPWLRRITRVLADAGPAIVTIDHSTKTAENRLHPSGSKRKRAAITGASYLIEAPTPLSRDHGGKLKITCAKDRHGNYRRDRETATLDITTSPTAETTATLRAPDAGDQPGEWSGPTHCIYQIVTLLTDVGTELSANQIVKALQERGQSFKRTTILAGARVAAENGQLTTRSGPRGSVLYRIPNPAEMTFDEEPF